MAAVLEAIAAPTLVPAIHRKQTAASILDAWRAGKSPHTVRWYHQDLAAFASFISETHGQPGTVDAVLEELFRLDSPAAHAVVLGYRNAMLDRNLAPATINRALATLRSISKLARMLGVVNGGWYLEVPGVKAEPRRDTRGPSVDDIRKMVAATAGDTEVETRDAAIVVTLFCLGLRVSELCGLRAEEVDLPRAAAWIRGKGRRERELVPLPPLVVDVLRRYLRHRSGAAQGPLFASRSHRRARDGSVQLNARSVLRIVNDLGQKVGVRVWCHALRHTAITEAIIRGQQAGIGLDQIRAFSRHRTLQTMLVYRDARDQAAVHRQLANVVADTLTEPGVPTS
jgi:integrase/recombinase XerC